MRYFVEILPCAKTQGRGTAPAQTGVVEGRGRNQRGTTLALLAPLHHRCAAVPLPQTSWGRI